MTAASTWRVDATPDALPDLQAAITDFARREGLCEPARTQLAAAVREAAAYAVDDAPGPVVVDVAAQDGRLSVRVEGHARRSGAGADVVLELPLVMALADRFAIGCAAGEPHVTVTMEFALGAGGG